MNMRFIILYISLQVGNRFYKMKEVIDVLQLQRDKRKVVPIDYRQSNHTHFIAVRYIFECGTYNYKLCNI